VIGVFAESTYLTVYRQYSMPFTSVDHLVMKPSGVGSSRWRIVCSTETDWQVIDFLVDTRGCVLLFERRRRDRATRLRLLSVDRTFSYDRVTRLRLLSVDKISTKTRDLAYNIGYSAYPVCV